MVLELQSYKFHLILQKNHNPEAAFLTLLTAGNPYRLYRPHREKSCVPPECPTHAKPPRFSDGRCRRRTRQKQPPTYRNPHISARHKYTSHIHRHCIIMCRSAHAPYSIIVLLLSGKTVTRQHVFNRPFHKHDITPESRHNSPERCGQGEGAENP